MSKRKAISFERIDGRVRMPLSTYTDLQKKQMTNRCIEVMEMLRGMFYRRSGFEPDRFKLIDPNTDTVGIVIDGKVILSPELVETIFPNEWSSVEQEAKIRWSIGIIVPLPHGQEDIADLYEKIDDAEIVVMGFTAHAYVVATEIWEDMIIDAAMEGVRRAKAGQS